MGQEGMDGQEGGEIVGTATGKYHSTVEYPTGPLAGSLKGIAQVKLADLGTRVFYTSHGTFDTHATQLPTHAKLWQEVSEGIDAFFQDLRAHDSADDVLMLVWSEFGRRGKDNGARTDHGPGSRAFLISE